ncbi:hypothetical protein RE474_09705 [Methanolobus sediminis]|uniref:Uncharacterized protein n=1 Tax=Methanolobus sediminis TaxID=3072978 RepID=A0AA51UJ70_9EURY|nr:hypothetical protein [Methanolobus sediminis]WMW24364.1 hypothetical protein RE474_09705 [Methanolobus sediminis]
MSPVSKPDISNLTNEQLDDMLAEVNKKVDSVHEQFSDLNSRICTILNDDPAGTTLQSTTTHSTPASIDDEVQLFKKRELEKLHLGYIIPILNKEVNY